MIRIRHHDACAGALAVLLAMMPAAAQTAEVRQAAVAVPASPAAMAQYRRALAEYEEAHAAYAAEADAYWSLITQKRRERAAKRASQERLSLGYNQLLATNSVEVVAESGHHLICRAPHRAR